jgi:hypothetical protein
MVNIQQIGSPHLPLIHETHREKKTIAAFLDSVAAQLAGAKMEKF